MNKEKIIEEMKQLKSNVSFFNNFKEILLNCLLTFKKFNNQKSKFDFGDLHGNYWLYILHGEEFWNRFYWSEYFLSLDKNKYWNFELYEWTSEIPFGYELKENNNPSLFSENIEKLLLVMEKEIELEKHLDQNQKKIEEENKKTKIKHFLIEKINQENELNELEKFMRNLNFKIEF